MEKYYFMKLLKNFYKNINLKTLLKILIYKIKNIIIVDNKIDLEKRIVDKNEDIKNIQIKNINLFQ